MGLQIILAQAIQVVINTSIAKNQVTTTTYLKHNFPSALQPQKHSSARIKQIPQILTKRVAEIFLLGLPNVKGAICVPC